MAVCTASGVVPRCQGRRLATFRWNHYFHDLSTVQLPDCPHVCILTTAHPRLLAAHGVGPDTAGALLVAAGDNSERLVSEQSFAALCGASPVQASSGNTHRHRLNRGGDRQANSALWRIVLVRMKTHPLTRDYVTRRTAEGLAKRDIMRYVAREIYHHINPTPAAGTRLRLVPPLPVVTLGEAALSTA